jgi:pyridoxal phosphate enzyme (YggS family)
MTPSASAPITVAEVEARLAEVRRRVVEAGGDTGSVGICAVTKGFGAEVVGVAVQAGLVDVGENYAQELVAKAGTLAGAGSEPVRWHMIGPVQRNKVRRLAPYVWCWQTVDRVELAEEIAARAPGARVFIQVNATGEASKSGVAPEDTRRLADGVRALGLELRGLMTVGPTGAEVDPHRAFETVRLLADELDVPERSMGMSRDLEAAVACGSTMVRVGTALFGPRPTGATVK